MRKNKKKTKPLIGIIRINKSGAFGFIDREKGLESIYIHQTNFADALSGDTVAYQIFEYKGKQEGRVLSVVSRQKEIFVGTFWQGRRNGKVKLDDQSIERSVLIPKDLQNNAYDGDKVLVKIQDFSTFTGQVWQVLGKSDSVGMDILALAKDKGIRTDFPQKALAQSMSIPSKVGSSELESRIDFRSEVVITIDGADSKDFDDAISIRKTDNGFQLGVHIADVSYYVMEGTALDKEARKRGNSVYLLDRVIPMLPENLSNGICSLNEGVDRLVLSCMLEFDNHGKRLSYSFVNGVIKSRKRLTYDKVQAFFDSGELDADDEVKGRLVWFRELAELLSEIRKDRGSIDFDFPEMDIRLDEAGTPVSITSKNRVFAHRLIEEFMLSANEAAAEFMSRQGKPFIYRVHESPDTEQIDTLGGYASMVGITLSFGGISPSPKEIAKFIERAKDYSVIKKLTLRSMKQARYSEERMPHFGLALEYYSHFTSPIRRYSDLYCHRIIKGVLNGESVGVYRKHLHEIADHTSFTERQAESLERDVNAMKAAEYMENHIGEEFDGVVDSITSFGVFVELDNLVNGLVHVDNLDGYFEFDKKQMKLINRQSGQTFELGQKVRVKVLDADKFKKEIDFEIVLPQSHWF